MRRSQAKPEKASEGVNEGAGLDASQAFGLDDLPDDVPMRKPGTGPQMGKTYPRVVERLVVDDPLKEYDELEAALELGVPGSRADYGTIVDALEKAERYARRAHTLWVDAKITLSSFEIDADIVEAGLRDQALAALKNAKEKGEFTKAISNPDVDAYMKAHFEDEYRDLATRREQAKRMVDSFEHLADTWKQRRRTLDTMAQGAK